MTHADYAIFFAVMAALVIALYVILDGFDLGVGILFPFAPRGVDRDTMMQSLAPMWDGNETWLVLGGHGLACRLPAGVQHIAAGVLCPAGVDVVRLGAAWRGVRVPLPGRPSGDRLDHRFRGRVDPGGVLPRGDPGRVRQWRHCRAGPTLRGRCVRLARRVFRRHGMGVVAGYAVLGATWLVWRTEGNTQIFAREIARPALLGTGAAIAVISIWTPIVHSAVAGRWFSWPGLVYLIPLPLVAAGAWLTAWRSLWGRREWAPFAATITLFLAALGGLGASIWPAAIPGVMTIEDAASSLRTQAIVAAALMMIVPLILAYVGYSYWVFRGKVGPGRYGH